MISEEAKEYLKNTENIRAAHLVKQELPGQLGAFVYMTDYFRDINYNGNTYKSDALTNVSSVRMSKELSIPSVSITLTGANETQLQRVLDSGSFLNRKITIYKVFLDEDGEIISMSDTEDALLYFEGKISSSKLTDASKKNSKSTIVWTCSNDFKDFESVNGRITDDESHRGLVNVNGELVPSSSAKKPEYQSDKGFFHANKSIGVIAQYQTKERRYKIQQKRAGGFRGFIGGKNINMVEYWENVVREVNIDVNLSAKYLPVIYGVQKVDGIPVFIDTDANDPSEVYVVYAFCEGEIEGFLDVYIDDKPIIAVSPSDEESRPTLGLKKDRGDTISIAQNSPNSTTGTTIDREKYTFNDGNGKIEMWFYHGSITQQASPVLVSKAASNGFKLQQDQGYGPEYWDNTFQLLDTAYAVFKFKLTSSRNNIPTISAEVQGRKINVYNQDGSITNDKTSLNFSWQTLDYLTNKTFGAGIDLSSVDIDSFKRIAYALDEIDESYEMSWLPYWRYLGWDDRLQDRRQLLQGSPLIGTDTSVFKNIKMLLNHMDASLNIIQGKYSVHIESNSEPVADIDYGYIIDGAITLQDNSALEKYNSVQVGIMGPASGWGSENITMYNSEFKEEDNNLDKKLTSALPFITNYYTARSRAEYLLNRSRYSNKISFSLPYSYLWLHPNSNITITNYRYGWDKKKFIVGDVTWNSNNSINVVAEEYEDSMFEKAPKLKDQADNEPSVSIDVLPPSNLRYVPLSALGGDSEYRNLPDLNGVLLFTPSRTTAVAYYSIRRTGSIITDTIQVTSETDLSADFSYPVMGLGQGEYTFEIRAVDRNGNVSFPVNLSVIIDPYRTLEVVPNFSLVNSSLEVDNIFVGGDVILEWDHIKDYDKVPGLTYKVQILDSEGVFVRNLTTTNTTITYRLDDNISDYELKEGNLGVYRELIFRIRAEGDRGVTSVDWATL